MDNIIAIQLQELKVQEHSYMPSTIFHLNLLIEHTDTLQKLTFSVVPSCVGIGSFYCTHIYLVRFDTVILLSCMVS